MKNLTSFCKICYLGIVLFVVNLSYAQGTATKRLQAGMTGNFGLNFQKMGSKKMDVNGVGSDLSVGVLIHTSFKNSNNIGLATGLEFDFETLKYNAGEDSVFYRYIDNEILGQDEKNKVGGVEFQLSERQIKPIYISIPLMLLFRTDPIGDFKYFGKFGIRNSFMVSQKINDQGVDFGSSTVIENTSMKSFGETFFYKGSIGFSAGAEWNFVGTTTLVPEISFFYGLTPMHYRFSDKNYSLYDGSDTYFYTKSKQNQLMLKISILF
ncbi:MAG: hypothetical protein RL059_895 [Bacteroidota bacterium]